MKIRTLDHVLESIPTADGAGVKLRRSLGSQRGVHVDPFLMLDEFYSDDPDDYIAGFPAHPHRGFETVTYMLDGHMRHEDHLGNRGDLGPGDVQWMTAARGIIHSEMPQQRAGRMRGFQLWLNLPSREKMKPAGYRDIQPEEIPVVKLSGGGTAKVIAGTLDGKAGPVQGGSTDPAYWDITLPPGKTFSQEMKKDQSIYIYPFEGSVEIVDRVLKAHQGGVLGAGDALEIKGGADGARFLVLAAKPIREPVVQYGPFVMNTREEIEQAIRDYQNGELTEA